MIIKAKIKKDDEWLFWEELPEMGSINTGLSEKHISINKHPIHITTYQIASNGFFVLCADVKASAPVDIISEIEGEAVVSQFIVSKSESVHGFTFSKHNIRYFPSLHEEHSIRSSQDFLYFLVVMTPELYEAMINIDTSLHLDFKEKIKEKQLISIIEEDLQVTSTMKNVIDDIRSTTNKNELKQIFLNARVLELIMLQFEQFSFINNKPTNILKIEDVQKLEEAQRILRNNFINPPTQKQLSKLILLNEFKLRNGFKQHFGTTIYNYITRIRMEEAKRLILNRNKNMYEVGTMVGFKHQASFTHAFKKYYGLLPSEISR